MLDNQTKACTKCGVEKSLTEFGKAKNGRLGRCSICTNCRWLRNRLVYSERRDNTPDGTKQKCTQCGESKDVVLFQTGGNQFGRRNTCLACDAAREANRKSNYPPEKRAAKAKQTADWLAKNMTEVLKKRRLKSTGFTHSDFEAAKALQDNCCAICHTDFSTVTSKDTHADHNHVTGERRGVLCAQCNRLLGFANDSANLLHRAAEYLENPPLRVVL